MSPHPRLERSSAIRPSLRLWRARHLVVAVCVGAAVLLALSILRPSPQGDGSALVAARAISAGEIIDADDERIVQVPVAVGGSLAEPGAIVDIIGESPVTIASASATPFATDGQADNSASSQAAASEDTRILCSGARVIGTTTEGDTSRFFQGIRSQ